MPTIVTVLLALVGAYLLLLAVLFAARPDDLTIREALRLAPDIARLVGRLARDPAVPRGSRATLWMLAAYLAMPIDLVPDIVPVLGYADDAILIALVLRHVVRAAGTETLRREWPGSDAGLEAVMRVAGIRAR